MITILSKSVPKVLSTTTLLYRSVTQLTDYGANTKLSILLTKVPSDFTESSLLHKVDAVKGLKKVEFQPGCSMHYVTENDARNAVSILKPKYEVNVRKTECLAL
jgi:hypothetical protein